MNEEVEAAKELAKTAGKTIDASVKLGGFFRLVFGETAIELGGVANDWAKLYRYKNLLKIQDIISDIHTKRKIEGKTIPIPPRYALPLIQSASEEDDDKLQNLWASLVANATDPNKNINIKKIFIEILSSMEPVDADILLYMSKQGWLLFPDVPGGGVNVKKLSIDLNHNEKDIVFSLENLNRLGCLIADLEPSIEEIGKSSFGTLVKNQKTTFGLSPLGFSLLSICEFE